MTDPPEHETVAVVVVTYNRASLLTRMLAGRLVEARRLARAFLPFGERVGEQWAVGTLRAVEAFASAELGDLAEADRGARRADRADGARA